MFLLEIDSDPKLAGMVAIAILAGVILICTLSLIIKKLLLNKKYKSDEEYVKNYRQKLKEREEKAQEVQAKPETIGEDF